MNKRTLPAVMLLATLSVAAQAAEMILYENPGFKGRQLTVSGLLPDINSAGFNNRNASVLVRSGTWEVCAEPNFRGFCAKLEPNEYGSLDTRFNGRISSARVVGAPVAVGGPVRSRCTAGPVTGAGALRWHTPRPISMPCDSTTAQGA
ncbi:MAG: beta/gamma crystallin family protein [Betaproteobacteria bacterium]|nr:beta/gamma crystallin family protein [Betaproteobacteria bacterium]